MVPDETIETKILQAFGVELGQEGVVTVVGIPDKSKGELLVLVTTLNIAKKELRKKLLATGIPILWIPREVKHVAQIPTLSTGKVDLAKCRELAIGR